MEFELTIKLALDQRYSQSHKHVADCGAAARPEYCAVLWCSEDPHRLRHEAKQRYGIRGRRDTLEVKF